MPTTLDRTRPGTITRNGVTTSYAPGATRPYATATQLGRGMDRPGSGGTITRGGMTRAYAPTPAPQPRAPQGPSPAAMDFLRTGNAPTQPAAYTPGQYGASVASRPPQQTERANPLTGGNNIPMQSTSVPVAAPFSQRGSAAIQAQDAIEAAGEEDMGTEDRIGSAMQGTFDRLRGTQTRSLFSPRFRQPSQRQPSYMDRVFRATPDMTV